MTPTSSLWRRLIELYRARHEPEAVRPLFTIVWRMLLMFFLFGTLVALLYATIVFTSVVETVNAVPASAKPLNALDRNALDQTIKEIRERQALHDLQ